MAVLVGLFSAPYRTCIYSLNLAGVLLIRASPSPSSRLLPPSPCPSPSFVFLHQQQEPGKFFFFLGGRSRPHQHRCSAQPLRVLAWFHFFHRGLRYHTSPPMSTPGSRATAISFVVMLFSVGAGIHSGAGGFGLLLGFMGVLAGANLIAVGIRMAHHPEPTFPAAFDGGARALAAFARRNIAAEGLVIVMASSAVTLVSAEAEPVLCFAMFALLLLGVSLINIGVRGE